MALPHTLDGRAVVVTGAGRGLGRAYALLIASEGASVVVNDLAGADGNAADAVVAEIVAAGGQAVSNGDSVTSWDSSKAIVDTALSSFGRLDGIVSNAGFLRDRMLTTMTEAEWDDVIKVHQYGAFYMMKHSADYWRAQSKDGKPVDASIVNITSISGLHSNIGQVNYGAAKAAIALMTLSASRELGRYGVRVNAVSPVARTRLTEKMIGPGSGVPAEDELDPSHVAPLVAWLLSPDSKASGQVYGAAGRSIQHYAPWHYIEEATTDQPWTVDSVREALQGWSSEFVPVRFPGQPE